MAAFNFTNKPDLTSPTNALSSSMSAPDKAPELEKDVVTEDTDAAQSEIDGNEEDDEEEEEKGECGFCLFMKGGGCKENFIAWENCINKAEEKKDGIAEKCFDITSALNTCMLAHPDYYEPILRAEKAAEEEAIKELDKEKAAETADNKEEVVIELENQKAAQETSKTAPAESSR